MSWRVGGAVLTASREQEREIEVESLVCKAPTGQHIEQETHEFPRQYKIGIQASTATSTVTATASRDGLDSGWAKLSSTTTQR
jgi:hypothetical protein